jgi:hypothetical protein
MSGIFWAVGEGKGILRDEMRLENDILFWSVRTRPGIGGGLGESDFPFGLRGGWQSHDGGFWRAGAISREVAF